MPFNNDPGGAFEALRDHRDQAAIKSHHSGKVRRLGNFTFGAVTARWETEEGGRAHLITGGLRYKDTVLPPVAKTHLSLMGRLDEDTNALTITTFSMDIDRTLRIDVYRTIAVDHSWLEHVRGERARKEDRLAGLSIPHKQELDLLQSEMQRGASGLYTC